jgi:uncharacterized membrane protein
MSNRAWRVLFTVVGIAILAMMAYAHDVIPGWELILGIVVGALLVVAGLRGRVL